MRIDGTSMRWWLSCLCAASMSFAACGKTDTLPPSDVSQQQARAMTQAVTIRLGESADSFLKRNPVGVKTIRQPAGLNFYRVDWDRPPYGTVTIENGKQSISIPLATGIQTSEDLGPFKNEGLFACSIYATVGEKDLIEHDLARQRIQALLDRILQAGWHQAIERSEPRLRGKSRWDYMLATTNLNGIDAEYRPSLAEWMRIENGTPWSFEANGIFMDVSFARDAARMDPAKPGAYLLTIRLQTAREYFRGFAGPENRLRWRDVIQQELAKAAQERQRKEAALRAKGLVPDESYRDPPLPPLN